MDSNDNAQQHAKVFYHPIEAAIRWSGLMQSEARILRVISSRQRPVPEDVAHWPSLKLNFERILDGLRNHELPYGKEGITCDDPALLDDPDLTIRHIDLRIWMARFYPNQKPDFLFDTIEQQLHPGINADSLRVLLADRDALQLKVTEMEQRLQALRKLNEQHTRREEARHDLPVRSEATYLNIVGGLLTLLLGQSPSGNRYSSFDTTDAIISALQAHFPGRPGLSERTLWSKFKAARQHVNTSPY